MLNFQNQISNEVTDLNQRLDTMQRNIDGIEQISSTQKQSLKRVSKQPIPQPINSTRKSGSDSAKVPAQSGTITEKDLIE